MVSDAILRTVLLGLFFTLSSACRSPGPASPLTVAGANYGAAGDNDSYDELIREINESQDELARVTAEAKSNSDRFAEIQAELAEKNAQLANKENMSAEERKAVQDEIDKLSKQLADLETQNKTLKDKQVGLEKQINDSKAAGAVSSTAGTSGFPLCGSVYYGITFNCNGKTCAKSDPNYVNICEITAASKPVAANNAQTQVAQGSSGYPFCGQVYYGSLFNCNGRTCAKSDPNYVNICEVGANSNAAVAAGGSGYPLCGGAYYGSVFNCNGRLCAKSDPNYVYICEIDGFSAPVANGNAAAGVGSSGYPFCPNPRYGTDFVCNNNRICAKSDPNYVNICEVP